MKAVGLSRTVTWIIFTMDMFTNSENLLNGQDARKFRECLRPVDRPSIV